MSPEANRPPTAPTLENVAWQKHAKSTRRPNPASPPTCNALDIRRGLLLIINLAACGEQEAPQRTRGGESTKDEQTLAERFCDGTLSVSEAVAFDDRAMKSELTWVAVKPGVLESFVALEKQRRRDSWPIDLWQAEVREWLTDATRFAFTATQVNTLSTCLDGWKERDSDTRHRGPLSFVAGALARIFNRAIVTGPVSASQIEKLRSGQYPLAVFPNSNFFGHPRVEHFRLPPRVVAYLLELLGCPRDRRHDLVRTWVGREYVGWPAPHTPLLPSAPNFEFSGSVASGRENLATMRRALVALIALVAHSTSTVEYFENWTKDELRALKLLSKGTLTLSHAHDLAARAGEGRVRRELVQQADCVAYVLDVLRWPHDERLKLVREGRRWASELPRGDTSHAMRRSFKASVPPAPPAIELPPVLLSLGTTWTIVPNGHGEVVFTNHLADGTTTTFTQRLSTQAEWKAAVAAESAKIRRAPFLR